MTQRARRLGIVRRFARYLRAEDARHEIPPTVFGAERRPRPVPYILSQDQIRRLVAAASRSGYRTLRRDTYATLFALLASTGLRVSEAIRLRLEDITPDGLVIRCSKFRKSRLVPLHDTARAGLERYLQRRLPYAPAELHVFVSLRRKPLLLHDVEVAFSTAARASGLAGRPGRARPTPHSLRHTFVVRALQACPDGRDAITQHMLALSIYLGHARVADTYWYLEAVPELMTDIADRCERFVMGGQ
jgi:integrase